MEGTTYKCIHGVLGTENYCADCAGHPLLSYSTDIVINRLTDTLNTYKAKFNSLREENEKLHTLQHDSEIANGRLNLHVSSLRAELARRGEIVEWAIRELEAYVHISARNELRRRMKEGK